MWNQQLFECRRDPTGSRRSGSAFLVWLYYNNLVSWTQNANQLFFSDQIPITAHTIPPFAFFFCLFCPTLHSNSGHVECTCLDYVAFPWCWWLYTTERHSSLLQKCFIFFPLDWEAIMDWINWLMSQLVTDYFCINLVGLEFQVLWHIPEIAVALVSRCIVNATSYISYTLPIWEADRYVVCLTPVLKYVPKQIT